MIQQFELRLPPMTRGCHLITRYIREALPEVLPPVGMVNVFVRHTSCGLTINENVDPDVRHDLAAIFDRIVPENQPFYEHTFEGPDDMPAHAKSTLAGVSVTFPVTGGKFNLGTWQGIYLLEFRNHGGPRSIVVTLYS